MLFSSVEFVVFFLPITLAVFILARKVNYSLSLAVLAALVHMEGQDTHGHPQLPLQI